MGDIFTLMDPHPNLGTGTLKNSVSLKKQVPKLLSMGLRYLSRLGRRCLLSRRRGGSGGCRLLIKDQISNLILFISFLNTRYISRYNHVSERLQVRNFVYKNQKWIKCEVIKSAETKIRLSVVFTLQRLKFAHVNKTQTRKMNMNLIRFDISPSLPSSPPPPPTDLCLVSYIAIIKCILWRRKK